jgi:hypothetical protein
MRIVTTTAIIAMIGWDLRISSPFFTFVTPEDRRLHPPPIAPKASVKESA